MGYPSYDMTFRMLQEQQKEWVAHNFPDSLPYHPLLGLNEEVGELNHAHLKGEQNIRHSPEEIQAMKIDAVGDIVIYLSDYCTKNGINFQDAVERTWLQVHRRDWQANKIDGKV